MGLLKISFYLLLSEIFIISAFADTKEDIYEKLSSGSSAEKIKILRSLKPTADKKIQQKVVAMALLDTDLAVRVEAESVLGRFLPVDLRVTDPAVHNGSYKTEIQKGQASLSSVLPDEQVKALQSLKDVENAHPLIQYTLIKEIIFRPISENLYKELVRLAAFDSYLQGWLEHISTTDTFPTSAQTMARNILLQIKPDLGVQRNLLSKVFNTDSQDQRIEGKNLLIKIKMDLEIQWELVQKTISDTTSGGVRNAITRVLEQNPYIALEIEQYLVDLIISNKSSEIAKDVAHGILFTRNLYLETQKKLLNALINAERISQVAQNIIKFIFVWNIFISTDIEKAIAGVAISNKVSATAQSAAQYILHGRNIRIETQRGLLNAAVSDSSHITVRTTAKNVLTTIRLDLEVQEKILDMAKSPSSTKAEKKVARYILVHNEHIYLEIEREIGFFLRCLRAFS